MKKYICIKDYRWCIKSLHIYYLREYVEDLVGVYSSKENFTGYYITTPYINKYFREVK